MSRTIVTFNGQNLTNSYYVSDLRSQLLPRDLMMQEVPGRDGMLYTGARLAKRTIPLRFTTMSKDMATRRAAARVLASILAVDEPKPLHISVDGDLYYMAVPTSTSEDTNWMNATSFDVEFECPDPVAYGEKKTLTVPSGGSLTFTVNGTYPTMPKISVASAANTDVFWLLTLENGDFLSVTLPTGVGAVPIVADCEQRTLKVNGSVAMLQPYADWLVLTPGQHRLTMNGTGAATVEYYERWL